MRKYKIGITDDHLLFAQGISNIIVDKPDMQLAFIGESASQMFVLMKEHPIDFLLLDINLAPYNGLELITQIKNEYSDIKITIN